MTHPRQPGSQHTVAETLANRAGPNTFHVVVECHYQPITARPYCLPTQSAACWYSWGFEIARHAGRLSANHAASYIVCCWVGTKHGGSHGIASEGIVSEFSRIDGLHDYQRKTIPSLLDGKDLFFNDLLTKQTQLLHTSTRHYDYRTLSSLWQMTSVFTESEFGQHL